MDPWSNHLNQAYGRLPPGTGLSANSTFHLLAEQQGFGTAAGLGASLSSPLPAHAALPSAAARFSSLSHMNYSALHGSMTPLFDPMALSQGFTSSSAYKTVPVVQTMYSLDSGAAAQSAGSSVALHESLGGRFVSQPSQSKNSPAIFSVDQQMGLSDNSGLSGGNNAGGASQWSRSSGFTHSAPANPYDGLSAGRSIAAPAGGAKSKQQEPPPAHSGSRSSAVHRSGGGYHSQQQNQQPSPQPPAQTNSARNSRPAVYEPPANQESLPQVSMQQLANLEFVQKLILDGQKLQGDNGSRSSNSRGVPDQRSNLSFAASPEPQRMTPAGGSRSIQQQGYNAEPQQTLQQIGSYAGYSERSGNNAASSLMYSSPAEQYDSMSSPELMAREQQSSAAAAILSQQSLGRFSGLDTSAAAQVMHVTLQDAVALAAAVGRNQLQGSTGDVRGGVGTPGGIFAVQAQPDSTTKPKRNRGGGKAAAASRGAEGNQPVLGMREEQPMEAAKEGNKRKGKGGGGGKGKNRKDDNTGSCMQEDMEGFNQAGTSYTQLMPGSFNNQSEYSGTDLDAYRQQQQKLSYQASLMSQVSAMFQDGNRSADEPQVFMTNMYGNAFVNPNEVLSLDSNLNNLLGGGASTSAASMDSSDDMNASCDSRPRGDSLTPKYRPVPAIIDEDFGHLVEDPAPQSSAVKVEPKPVVASNEPTGFMNSFLNFVSGKKPDTLQTASTAMVKKPVLPKYIPDVTPRRPVEVAKPSSVAATVSLSSTGTFTSIKPGTSAQQTGKTSTPVGKGMPVGGFTVSSGSKSPAADRKGSKGRPGRKRASIEEEEEESDEDEAPKSKKGGTTLKGQRGGKKVEIVVPPRERSSRKAKEKVEQKRKAKAGKRKSSLYADSDDEQGELEDLSPIHRTVEADSDSDDEWRPSEGRGADRSRRVTGDDTDMILESKSPKRRGKTVKSGDLNMSQTPGPAKARQRTDVDISNTVATTPSVAAIPAVPAAPVDIGYVYEAPEEPEDRPHNYEKGNFLIDRKDLGNHLSYPIWKIDTGRLLQKYEATEKDGRLIHRSLTTYSSWSDNIEKSHRAIDVRILSTAKGMELVEVLEQYRPKPPSAARLEAENARDSFNVFVQILVSQALEPTFLGALFSDGDEYYMNPLRKIEGLLSDRTSLISNSLGWTQQFKDAVNKYASYKLVDCAGIKSEVLNEPVEAVKQIRLFGAAYEDQTLTVLEELPIEQAVEYAIEQRSADVVPLYHSIQHIKWSMCRVCRAKIEEVRAEGPELVDHEVLDKCLQMSDWMQELFQRFADLLEGVDQWKIQNLATE